MKILKGFGIMLVAIPFAMVFSIAMIFADIWNALAALGEL